MLCQKFSIVSRKKSKYTGNIDKSSLQKKEKGGKVYEEEISRNDARSSDGCFYCCMWIIRRII